MFSARLCQSTLRRLKIKIHDGALESAVILLEQRL